MSRTDLGGGGETSFVGAVGGRGDLAVVLGERPADRLDSAEAVPVLVDERYERRCGRSSPAAKKLAAALRISLARPSSAISFVIALIRAGLLAGRARTLPGADLAPAHPVTQRLGGTDVEFSATAHNAADSFGWSPRTSATMRTARRRNSDGWEEGRDMTRIHTRKSSRYRTRGGSLRLRVGADDIDDAVGSGHARSTATRRPAVGVSRGGRHQPAVPRSRSGSEASHAPGVKGTGGSTSMPSSATATAYCDSSSSSASSSASSPSSRATTNLSLLSA